MANIIWSMYFCSSCQQSFSKWTWKCPNCSEWNTLEERVEVQTKNKKEVQGVSKDVRPLRAKKRSSERISVSSKELSTVLGGGIVPGSFLLLSGEPGIGKSTLTLQITDWVASEKTPVVYVSGEEGEGQIADRAHRLGFENEHVFFLHEHKLEDILATLAQKTFGLVIIDSISVMYSSSQTGGIGSISQIRVLAESFMEYAKQTNTAVMMIGHVTKDGELAGPKTLEHLVDTVLYLEGSRHGAYRILRTMKNRFGPTHEVGIFIMDEKGLHDVAQPGIEFLSQKPHQGSALGMVMEGTRPMIIEIEALVTPSRFGYPKRSAQGIRTAKLDQILAVVSRFTGIHIDQDDVYVNISRGFSTNEPAIDLAIVAALLSSKLRIQLPALVFIGEVSLTGRIRPVTDMSKRISFLQKLDVGVPVSAGGDEEQNRFSHISDLVESDFFKNV